MVLFDLCFVPFAFGGAFCLLGGLGNVCRCCCIGTNRVHAMNEVDDRPMKMSAAEREMHNLHMNAYGGHNTGNKS